MADLLRKVISRSCRADLGNPWAGGPPSPQPHRWQRAAWHLGGTPTERDTNTTPRPAARSVPSSGKPAAQEVTFSQRARCREVQPPKWAARRWLPRSTGRPLTVARPQGRLATASQCWFQDPQLYRRSSTKQTSLCTRQSRRTRCRSLIEHHAPFFLNRRNVCVKVLTPCMWRNVSRIGTGPGWCVPIWLCVSHMLTPLAAQVVGNVSVTTLSRKRRSDLKDNRVT